MKTTLIILFTTLFFVKSFSQETKYDAKYHLTVYTINRSVEGELLIINGYGNSFTGVLKIVGEEREVFGWYTEKISEGGIYIYNTKGIVFYVKLNADFQHQQLFKGILSYDGTKLSGEYFYWGNEFIFNGYKADPDENPDDTIINTPNDTIRSKITIIVDNNIGDLITISPNPVNNTLTISSSLFDLSNLYIELYSDSGILIKKIDLLSNITQIDLSMIPAGSYIVKIFNKEGQELGTVKIIKC